MAKLPDETAFGAIDAGVSGRPIATFDTTGYARGAAALASGAKDLGAGLETAGKQVAYVGQLRQKEDDALEVARAKSDFLTGKVELDASLSDETDHATLPGRYSAKLQEIKQGAAAKISNPRTRELFDLSVSDDVARGNATADNTATKLWKDATLADTHKRLEGLRDAALKSTDPAERAKLIQTGNDLITSLTEKSIITKDSAVKVQQEWTTKYAAGAISILPAQDRVKALGGFEGALIGRESGGKPTTINQFGYAGLYQFGAPRLAAMGVYQPGSNEDLKAWSKSGASAPGKWSGTFSVPGHPEVRTLDDFLKSPDAQRAAFNVHSSKMDQEIKENGFDKYIGQTVGGVQITREGLQAMLHLGGVGGTKNALEGKGNAADANGTSVLEYAKLGQQSDLVRIAGILPEDTRVRMRNEAQAEIDRNAVKVAAAQSETWERKIIDAGAGIGTLPNRADIEQDTGLDEPRRNALLRQYDSAAGDVVAFQRVLAKFKDKDAGPFNPYDKDEAKSVDTLYAHLGGDAAALNAVVARTGIMPKAAAVSIRGGIISNDPKRVVSALTVASNLVSSNPNIFSRIEGGGGQEIENNAVAFRHYVDDLGMTAEEAAKKVIRDQSPEYQASVKAKLKAEDVDAKIKKELSIGDLSSAFDQVPWIPFTDPNVGFDPGSRQVMFGQYAEQVKERYLETGDWSLAKRQAADTLKKTWGVTKINGSSTVVQYPPERAPAYSGIENSADMISAQAIEAAKSEGGQDVDRKGIRLMPIPGITAQAYKSGQPVPYNLMWSDKDGVVHMINPGKAFVADPKAMQSAISEKRKAALDEAFKANTSESSLFNEARSTVPQRRTAQQREIIDKYGNRPPVVERPERQPSWSELTGWDRPAPAEGRGLAALADLPPQRRKAAQEPGPKVKVAEKP